MILSYVYNTLKYRKWRLLLPVALFIFSLKATGIILNYCPHINQLQELHKCPVCYGTSACNYINKISIVPLNFLELISYLFGVGNVFLGLLDENKIILKKLAHSEELEQFDRMLCENKELSHFCTKNIRDYRNDTNFHQLIEKEITRDFINDNLSRLRICPSTKNLNELLHNVFLNNRNVDKGTLEINIWTLVSINPEPLLLQILSANKGWPVPKYLGACGRVIIEEYVGLPLTAYHNAPWLIRAEIAISLLNAAYMFTFKNQAFGFYLTDISADNIAVDSHNQAKFIDLENVIVVDKNVSLEERPKGWEQLHENTESLNCPNCLSFSPMDICSHQLSDHNFYAICQLLLDFNIKEGLIPGGLLHSIPKDVLQQYSNMRHLIQQCSNPKESQTRINAGLQLKNLLETILLQRKI